MFAAEYEAIEFDERVDLGVHALTFSCLPRTVFTLPWSVDKRLVDRIFIHNRTHARRRRLLADLDDGSGRRLPATAQRIRRLPGSR